ncbi:zinc dependent phospholipase C family protein [Shewanella algae]|uniref:zinc dependent phospholipase C family protein n=1 Tax=Shewanella algae TaxID=38313 RepID=UPI0031F5821E
MPGAYAHLTLVNSLRQPLELEAVTHMPKDAIRALLKHFKYCELGAVSPDYPYLALNDRQQAKSWADKMHYQHSGEMLKAGVRHLACSEGEERDKGLAWLLGYCAHVITDVTVHPVIEMKVGPYKENADAHRYCEMHQDAYIYPKLNLGAIGLSEHLDSGIAACCDATGQKLDPVIERLWDNCFKDVYIEEWASNAPAINDWHKGFITVVDKIAEEGNRLLPFARHLGVKFAVLYPEQEQIEKTYLTLTTPEGDMHYDAIFLRARENVKHFWQLIASGVLEQDSAYLESIKDWNLDTGRDAAGKLAFWQELTPT